MAAAARDGQPGPGHDQHHAHRDLVGRAFEPVGRDEVGSIDAECARDLAESLVGCNRVHHAVNRWDDQPLPDLQQVGIGHRIGGKDRV